MGKTFFFISSSDLSKPGAAQFRLLAIARGLCEHGAQVNWILIASRAPDSIANDEKYRSINFVSVGELGHLANKGKIVAFLYRMYLLFTLGQVTSKLTLGTGAKALFSVGDSIVNLMLISRVCRQHKILLFHERTEYPYLNSKTIAQRLNLYLYLKVFIPQCDHIFVISGGLKIFFGKQAKGRQIPISMLNMMVEPDRYLHERVVPSAKTTRDIVYVGTPYGEKDGVYNLIKAFAIVMDKYYDTRLVIVGDTSRPKLLTKVYDVLEMLSDKSRVVFTGSLARPEVIERLNSAYCLALARPANVQAEYGFPTKLGEYLSTGRPVVITGVGDIPMYLEDGYNAFVAIPGQATAFAAKLAECLADKERATEIGERGRELVYHQFNYKSVTKVVFDALKD